MKTRWMSGLVLGCLSASCGSVQDVQHAQEVEPAARMARDENEVQIALDQVPEAIKKAALAAVAGFELVSAETETEEGELRYCLEGTADGQSVEIEVNAADGKVVEIERGDDDDEEDGDDDDDDDEEEDEEDGEEDGGEDDDDGDDD